MKTIEKNSSKNLKNIHEHDEYVKIISEKFNDKIVITGKYKGYKENIAASCKIHGPIINKKAGDLKRSKYACSICAKEEKIKATSDAYDIVLSKASTIHDNLYSYKNANISKKVTDKSTFINKSNEIHNNKYDYKNVDYISMFKKVDIYCNKCHKTFSQRPNDNTHNKQGCPSCANIINAKRLRLSKDDFIMRAADIHGDKYNYLNFRT